MRRTATAIAPEYRVTEPDLIARILAGDRIAARELYDAHAPRVFRLAFRLTGETDLARECTQDTFVRAFGQLARFRGEAALSTWIHRICLSVVANSRRKVKRLRDREADLDEARSMGAEPVEADPDLRDRLASAIEALPEIYRTTFVLHDIEGYTHTEIAELHGVAEGTCKSRLFTARAQLRAKLKDFRMESEP